ncbi:MAG: GDYXXLXY domain-containing protein [Acidiferrobacterales bacterium]|nr:GDYXXLXY domain-containing protein [Acidiferrobacterales bacterium]
MIKLLIAITIVAQLLIPASMILRYESVLDHGELMRFEVRPVDPVNPFRGRYVRLNFSQERVPSKNNEKLPQRSDAYALISVDDQGLANVTSLSVNKPENGTYLKVSVRYRSAGLYSFRYPFDRYYANEAKAPKIEGALRDRRDNTLDDLKVVAEIKIKDGFGVIEELYVGKQTIHEYLQHNK